MSEAFAKFFLVFGTLFIAISGFGILRLPDTLCRAHALSKALTFGVMLLFFALFLTLEGTAVWIKLFLALVFQLLTIPVAGHVFALYAVKNSE